MISLYQTQIPSLGRLMWVIVTNLVYHISTLGADFRRQQST